MQPTFGMCIIMVGGGWLQLSSMLQGLALHGSPPQTATLKYHQGDTVAKTMTLVSEVGIGVRWLDG